MNSLSNSEIGAKIDALIATRYPYEVGDILRTIEEEDDRVIIVAAALARSVEKGRYEGREQARQAIRERLGL